MAFETADPTGAWQRLKGLGVEFIEDPTDYVGDMFIATLKDAEGDLVQLWQYRGVS